MRVLLVSPSASRVGCGVGDHVARLAAELDRRGYAVHLATDPAGSRRRDLPPGVEVHTSFRHHTAPEVGALARLARRLAPDVVHLHYQVLTYSDRAAILAFPHLLPRRTARAVSMHDFLLPYIFRGAGVVRRGLLRELLRGADAVVVSTRAHYALALASGARAAALHDLTMASNIEVSPLSAEREAELRERFEIGDRTLASAFGAISLAGGAELLLAALAAVPAAARRRLRCLLVGGAPAYAGNPERDLAAVGERLRELGLADCARVTGYLEAEEVSGLLQMSRAVIQPRPGGISPMNTSVACAILHRRPLLAIGRTDLLDARMPTAAIHFSAPEPAALADAIRRLLDGEALWPESAAAVLAECARRFSWDSLAGEHEALYAEIAARRRAGA
jgi:glycosyltransferase involved in cell wall biosynthesis